MRRALFGRDIYAAANIASRYEEMRKGAKGGLSRSQRERAVRNPSCFDPEVTQRPLASIGAEEGGSFLQPAEDFAASREPIYGSP